MKKMKNSTMAVVAIVILASAVGAAYYLGYIDIPDLGINLLSGDLTPSGANKLQVSSGDIYTALDTISTKELNLTDVEPYFSTLNMGMWCSPMSALPLAEWYDAELTADGWAPSESGTRSGSDWIAYIRTWTRGDQAYCIIVGEGASVNTIYGCTTVYIMGHGSIGTVEQFLVYFS